MKTQPLHIISLGAGVQSSTTAASSCALSDWLDALRANVESVEILCQHAQCSGDFDLLTDLSNIKRNLKDFRRQMESASNDGDMPLP